ncbi:mucin-like protein [Stylophora pistillata]|uniref:mucin-like protein n=1 Tax=Stylophora pistillata TaxID=50429 RepID=UPI000C0518AD|nr:mucin-like protein [Stylophora pistillata]
MSKLDKKEGNTGVVGRHFWRIENSDGKGAQEKCFSWARMNVDWDLLTWYNQFIKSDPEMACPCTGRQARFDWGRFRWSWWNSWPNWCFESRRSRRFVLSTEKTERIDVLLRQQCCYSREWEDWAALKQGPPDGGRIKVTLTFYGNNSKETFYTDEEAFKSCCVDIPRCNLFYKYRPSNDCSGYRPPIRRWFWGDPHIKTLDGGNYTFNGIGEYIMVDAQNGTFQLQARTKLAQGNSTKATIFSAGVAKEENTSTIEVKVKDGGGFHILIDSESYYGFNNLTNKTEEVGRNLSVSKIDEDCLQVSFPSTSSVQFCEKKEMMSFVVTLGDRFKNATKGLLGTWNDDTEDDFTLPDGTLLSSSSSSSLRKIHFGFGVKWQINQSQSLFTYADNKSVASFSDLDFVPMFADNITWQNDSIEQEAKAQCGDDHECLFDVASTNDLSVGLATKDISVQLVNESKQLNNFPPKIGNTSDEINATLHKIIELDITAEDDSAITFRVINKPVGATWNQTGNVLLFHWKVTSSQKINLTFVASDDQGASAIWSPTIRMCACQHDGQCVEPEEGDAENTDSKFVYLGCVCQGGYTGRFCDSDIDACKLNGEPCYAGVECTDLPPPANSSGYECGPCPSGYTGDGAQCVDIDECKK